MASKIFVKAPKPSAAPEAAACAPEPRLEQLLTVDDVARRCNVSDKTIRRWIASGALKCRIVGPSKRLRIERADLDSVITG